MNTIGKTLRQNLAAEINKSCELAHDKADEAIGYAMQAGKLLLEAKAAVPHGDWLSWMRTNLTVTPRQAQRYMRIAQGRPMPARCFGGSKDGPASVFLTAKLRALLAASAQVNGRSLSAEMAVRLEGSFSAFTLRAVQKLRRAA